MINLQHSPGKAFHNHKSIKLMDLEEMFGEKSFALAFILLMMTAAWPLPTGGITPFFWNYYSSTGVRVGGWSWSYLDTQKMGETQYSLSQAGKGMGRLVGFVRCFEKFSRNRGHFIANHHLFVRRLVYLW